MKQYLCSPKLINLILRGSTLVCKFGLVFFLAKFLAPEVLGLYGLILVTVSFLLYLYGLDFYIFATREVIHASPIQKTVLIRNQLTLYLLLYIVVSPCFLILFILGQLPWYIAPLFFAVAILEHLAQEANRLLIALAAPIFASVVLFFRSGLWSAILILLMYLRPEYRNLESVLSLWLAGLFIALGFAIFQLRTMGIIINFKGNTNWNWLYSGLKVALPFLIGTLALRAIYTIDRYWIEAYFDLRQLGVYAFFASVAGTLMTVLDATVFTFMYPQLIAANASQQHFSLAFKQLLHQTLIWTVVSVVAAITLIHPVLFWLQQPLYQEHSPIFYGLLFMNVMMALSMIPHYALYAQKHDKSIIYSHILALFLFIILLLLFGAKSMLAVVFSLCGITGFLLSSKTYFYLKFRTEAKVKNV